MTILIRNHVEGVRDEQNVPQTASGSCTIQETGIR